MIATKISFFENIFQKFIQSIIILMIAIIEDNDIFMIFWKIFCNDFFNDIFVFFWMRFERYFQWYFPGYFSLILFNDNIILICLISF